MKSYVRLMLGKKGTYAAECFAGGFIGVNFGIAQDLSARLPEDVRTFKREFIPIYLAAHPDVTSKIAAGLSCGFPWTVSKWIKIGTVSDVTRYREEIEDVAAFAMERHLEDFLAQNGAQTELGKEYDIFDEDGERVVQQYPSDTGPIDILAVSKDKTRLLVVELQKGLASDAVVGQTLRYRGFVQEVLAEGGRSCREQ